MKIKRVLFCCLLLWAGAALAAGEEELRLPDIEAMIAANPQPQEVFAAIAIIGRYIDAEPENHAYYEMIALGYEYLQIYPQAIEALKLAIQYYPEHGKNRDVLYANLGRVYFQHGDYEQATEVLHQAIELNQGNTDAWNYLLYMYVHLGNYEAAAQMLHALRDLTPHADVYYGFLLKAREIGVSPDQIEAVLRASLRTQEENHFILRALAVAVRESGRTQSRDWFDEARDLLERSVAVKPDYTAAYLSLADSYLLHTANENRRTRLQAAKQAYRLIKKAEPFAADDPAVSITKGEVFIGLEKYDRAIALFRELAERYGYRSAIVTGLVHAYEAKAYVFYQRHRNTAEGLALIEEALFLQPQDAAAVRTHAGLLLQSGRAAQAAQAASAGLCLNIYDSRLRHDLERIRDEARQQSRQ